MHAASEPLLTFQLTLSVLQMSSSCPDSSVDSYTLPVAGSSFNPEFFAGLWNCCSNLCSLSVLVNIRGVIRTFAL